VRVTGSFRLAPAIGFLAFLLAVPVSGFGQRGALPNNQGQGRGSATASPTPTPSPAKAQNPAARGQGQPSPRPTPSAEQFFDAGWWNDEAIKKEIKLTDVQVRRITQLFDRRVRAMTATYDDYRKERAALEKMTQERTVDEGTFAAQVGKTQYLLSKLNESRTVMLYTIYMVLDPKQYEALRTIRDRRFGRGGGAPTR